MIHLEECLTYCEHSKKLYGTSFLKLRLILLCQTMYTFQTSYVGTHRKQAVCSFQNFEEGRKLCKV